MCKLMCMCDCDQRITKLPLRGSMAAAALVSQTWRDGGDSEEEDGGGGEKVSTSE